MTVSSNSIGTNTVQITISGETSSANILTAIDAAIVNGGWEQHDVYNNGTQRIYRSLCKDGVTFKYFGMFFDPVGGKITTTAYEAWNNETHVGANEVATYDRTGQMHYTLSGCDIIVMISPRWLILQTFIRNNPGPWAGVFECSREAAEDTPEAGFPPFMWITSVLASTTGNTKYASFPRSRANSTGVAATANGWQTQYVRLGAQTGLSGKDLVPMTTYAWDTSKKIVQSLRPTFGATELHGKMFGLKAVSNIGAPYSRVSLPIDSDYQFSPNGTPTEHWVLANTPGYYSEHFGPMTTPGVLGTGMGSSMGTCTLPSQGRSLIFTGSYFYITHATGISKVDGTTQSLSGSTGTLSGVSAIDHRDIAFDGRYVYAASATGITRVDTQNADAVSTLAITNGTDSVFFDGANLWAGSRVPSLNVPLYKIDTSTFTLSATVPLPTTGTAAYGSIGGMCTDYAGNLYVPTGDGKMFKVVIATNVVSLLGSYFTNGATAASATFNGSYINITYISSSVVAGVSVTTAGTVLNAIGSFGQASSAYASGTQPSFKLAAYKIGCFNGAACASTNGTNNASYFTTTGVMGTPSSNLSTLTLFPSNATAQSAFATCDGGRIYAIINSTFTVINNVCHPDEGATAMNRFLLPK